MEAGRKREKMGGHWPTRPSVIKRRVEGVREDEEGSLEGFLPGVCAVMDQQLAIVPERSAAAITDEVPLISRDKKTRLSHDQHSYTNIYMLPQSILVVMQIHYQRL